MSDTDKTMVRLLVRGLAIVSQLLACFKTPRGMQEAVTFTEKNLERLVNREDKKTWKDVRMNKNVPIDTLTNLGTELHWMSMKLNVLINSYRRAMGCGTVDFEREAIEYDILIEKGEKSIDDKRA